MDNFSSLSQAFAERVSELKRLALLRVSDSAKDLYQQDMAALDVSLRALEGQLKDIKAFVAREKQTIPKVQALIEASEQQRQHLQYIASHLPQHLPSLDSADQQQHNARRGAEEDCEATGRALRGANSHQQTAAATGGFGSGGGGGGKENRLAGGAAAATGGAAMGGLGCKPSKEQADGPKVHGAVAAAEGGGGAGADAGGGRQQRVAAEGGAADKGAKPRAAPRPKVAPRRYITQQELASLPAYMRGPRLTLEQANSAVDELASYSEANAKLVASARGGNAGGGGGVRPVDRKHATALLHDVAKREGIRGHFWFLEGDCRAGRALKLDKSGRALLAALRALGRLSEHRVTVDGAREVVYVLV